MVLGEVTPARMPHECHEAKEGQSSSTEDREDRKEGFEIGCWNRLG